VSRLAADLTCRVAPSGASPNQAELFPFPPDDGRGPTPHANISAASNAVGETRPLSRYTNWPKPSAEPVSCSNHALPWLSVPITKWQTAEEEFDETVDRSAFTMSEEPEGLFMDLD
jgi:hypothetical protein